MDGQGEFRASFAPHKKMKKKVQIYQYGCDGTITIDPHVARGILLKNQDLVIPIWIPNYNEAVNERRVMYGDNGDDHLTEFLMDVVSVITYFVNRPRARMHDTHTCDICTKDNCVKLFGTRYRYLVRRAALVCLIIMNPATSVSRM